MDNSPAKRRKTSSSTAVAIDASTSRSNPSTPKRASFQSPTKASLARSHPNLLPRASEKSRSESTGKSLRQELLGQRDSQNDLKTATSAPHAPQAPSTSSAAPPVETGAPESFSAAVARTFATEPRRISHVRPPLRARQAPIAIVGDLALRAGWDPTTSMPKHPTGRPKKNGENEEPELPPTPVELGLEKPPERPRGLASSSPRSGRSGSGSGTDRMRRRGGNSQTSSPLKPKIMPARTIEENPRETSISIRPVANLPQEAPESDPEQPEEEEIATGIGERNKNNSLREELATELARLEAEIKKLESAFACLSTATSAQISPEILMLLKRDDHEADVSWSATRPLPEQPTSEFAPLPSFLPGSLSLKSSTSATLISSDPHLRHALELACPPPWPANTFSVNLNILVNTASQQIRSIELTSIAPKTGTSAQYFRKWLETRLASPLHQKDIGSLSWGFGRWWEESVLRAEAWKALAKKGWRTGGDLVVEKNSGSELTTADVKGLLPYLGRRTMTFDVSNSTGKKTDKPKAEESKMKLMLEWDLELDWTGEVSRKVGLSPTGVSLKAQEGIKDVFRQMERREGVLPALKGVWEILSKAGGPGR